MALAAIPVEQPRSVTGDAPARPGSRPAALSEAARAARLAALAPRFESLVLSAPARRAGERRSWTGALSGGFHALLVAAIILVPLLRPAALPDVNDAVRAFFVTPPALLPPPPPPPPPAPASRVIKAVPAPVPSTTTTPTFVAPIEVPSQIETMPSLDFGVEGGVPGGVEGGVPGGVIGGVVGGLPLDAPPPTVAPRVVRIGGHIKAPKLILNVPPVYPPLAVSARVQGSLLVEAEVGPDGRVVAARVLRGMPLLDAAALEAVRQWRYQPLLLNGEPTGFILSVTVVFRLAGSH
jgi:protein TonB